jgi:hypothetical protein
MLTQRFDQLFGAEQARMAGTLDQIVIPRASFTAQRMTGKSFEVHYQVGSSAGEVPPFSVLYVVLGPWDGEIASEALARVDSMRAGVLPTSFARGTRLFTAVERREALLGCSVRLAARRWELI